MSARNDPPEIPVRKERSDGRPDSPIENIRNQEPAPIASFFRVLEDTVRLHIVEFLCGSEHTGQECAEHVGLPAGVVARHLSLREPVRRSPLRDNQQPCRRDCAARAIARRRQRVRYHRMCPARPGQPGNRRRRAASVSQGAASCAGELDGGRQASRQIQSGPMRR